MSDATKAVQLILALVITNAGGEGKSTWAEILAALGTFANLDVVVADVDPGNRGYLNRNGDEAGLPLDWSPKADAGSVALADPAQWYNTHLAGRDLAILDTGANMLASASPITQFIGGLIAAARGDGARVIIYCVTSPQKPGSDELVEMMYNRFRRGAEVMIVQNDRDGSNAFKPSLAALGTPIVSVPHLQPGVQEVRLRRRIPLAEVLSHPEPGYERATGLLAKLLLAVAKQNSIIDVIGCGAIEPLGRMSCAAPNGFNYRIGSLKVASNAAVTANEELATAARDFRRSDANETATFLKAARALWNAERNWQIHSR